MNDKILLEELEEILKHYYKDTIRLERIIDVLKLKNNEDNDRLKIKIIEELDKKTLAEQTFGAWDKYDEGAEL